MEFPGIVTTIWGYIRLGLDKLREILMYISTFLAKYTGFSADNIYNVLIIVLSFYIAKKIFFARNTTLEGRWGTFLIVVGIVYFILKII